MLTNKVKKRIFFITLSILIIFLCFFVIFDNLRNNLLYFKTPTEIKTLENQNNQKKIRVGGMVKKNSITIDKEKINFVITDFKNEVNVVYRGAVPSLFLEEKGVIAEGILKDNNFFVADKILAKHDENYMPPELKDINKKND
tara:strand:+ start:8174 stop:8599 length:426 start_codon:yes stop_codon:yes gene_type:complete